MSKPSNVLKNSNILEDIIYQAVDKIQPTLPSEMRIHKDPDSLLFGVGAPLDSIGLVNFVLVVEELIQTKTGKAVRLVNESSMSATRSPFRTLKSLSEYIQQLEEFKS
jgi:hypothetical protein